MSFLTSDDPARQLDIFKFHPDFDHSKIEIWSQNLPDYSEVKPLICGFDIETPPIVKDIYGEIDFDHPDNMILSIALELNEKYIVFDGDEKSLIKDFIDFIQDPDNNIYVLAAHNGFRFDLPYIITRSKVHKIGHAFQYKREWNGMLTQVKNSMMFGRPIEFLNIVHPKFNIIDSIHLCAIADKREAKLSSYNLKHVCGPEGYDLREGNRVEIPGDKIYEMYKTNKSKYFEYLRDDIKDLMLLTNYHLPSFYYLLKYIPNINLQNLVFSGNAQKWNLVLKKRYPNSFPESDSQESYLGGMTGIRSGVFKNCAKDDVESLYPSIMVAMRLHSRKDPAQYQLQVLSILKKRRLELKHMKSNKEAKFESDALKVLINSGYGALGTAHVAYNDFKAAAAVTAYGRKVLDTMLSYLQNINATIVQFDTDGVIFCHDSIPVEEIHKRLQRIMPDWVKLDLEDKFDYVWIYKRKNYVTYKGNKIKAVGILRKRDKSELFKRYLKYLPTLYINHGMEKVESFTNNVIEKIKNRTVDIKLLAVTEKITQYTNGVTVSQKQIDLNAQPGESVNFYVIDVEEEYITPKKKEKKTRHRYGFKRVSDYANDYSIDYYINEIMEHKWSKSKLEYTSKGWYWIFRDSIERPVIEYSTDADSE